MPCPDCRGEEWRRGQRRERYEALMGKARIPALAMLQDWSFANFPVDDAKQDAFDAARLWADGDPALRRYWQLYLHGRYGSGKTGLAVAILRASLERGEAGLFWTVPDLVTAIKGTFGRQGEDSEAALLEQIGEADMLVLDDVGESEPSDYVRGKLYQIINKRAYDRRLTVYTSNYPWPALEGIWDTRIVQRVKYGCLPLPLGGANLREQGGE